MRPRRLTVGPCASRLALEDDRIGEDDRLALERWELELAEDAGDALAGCAADRVAAVEGGGDVGIRRRLLFARRRVDRLGLLDLAVGADGHLHLIDAGLALLL